MSFCQNDIESLPGPIDPIAPEMPSSKSAVEWNMNLYLISCGSFSASSGESSPFQLVNGRRSKLDVNHISIQFRPSPFTLQPYLVAFILNSSIIINLEPFALCWENRGHVLNKNLALLSSKRVNKCIWYRHNEFRHWGVFRGIED